MTTGDQYLLAEVAWKENRGGGTPGMTSIINVVLNRAAKSGRTPGAIILAPKQFTSMSVTSDPEYTTDPTKSKGADLAAWAEAQQLAAQAAAGALEDITQGATLYYAPKSIQTTKTFTLPSGEVIPFPAGWNPSVVTFTAEIQNQVFFRQ